MESHIQCLKQACINKNLPFQLFDNAPNILKIKTNPELIFANNRTPFNTETMAKICLDKANTYELLYDKINMPKTRNFLDYNVAERYKKYLKYTSLPAILDQIIETFTYPLVIKMNKGALGQHVYLCPDPQKAEQAIQAIFDKNTHSYDYIALAQEYIQPKREFRAVYFRKTLVLCYQRISENPNFGIRYWDTNQGRAEPIHDTKLLAAITQFAQPALALPGLNYIGLDILEDTQGNYYLLEMNSGPQYNHYIQSCGKDDIIALYEKILTLQKS